MTGNRVVVYKGPGEVSVESVELRDTGASGSSDVTVACAICSPGHSPGLPCRCRPTRRSFPALRIYPI